MLKSKKKKKNRAIKKLSGRRSPIVDVETGYNRIHGRSSLEVRSGCCHGNRKLSNGQKLIRKGGDLRPVPESWKN